MNHLEAHVPFILVLKARALGQRVLWQGQLLGHAPQSHDDADGGYISFGLSPKDAIDVLTQQISRVQVWPSGMAEPTWAL